MIQTGITITNSDEVKTKMAQSANIRLRIDCTFFIATKLVQQPQQENDFRQYWYFITLLQAAKLLLCAGNRLSFGKAIYHTYINM